MQYWLASSPWYGFVVWVILYTSDYYLTLYCARGFREIGHIQFEGSFELTPEYQKDIDSLKTVSKRHIIALVLSSICLALVWWVTRLSFYLELAYPLFLGMFLLLEVGIHLRHFRNVGLIQEARRHGGMEGQITYKKWFSYRISANDLYIVSALFLLTTLLTNSLFFLGSALTCFATGIRHSQLARKARSSSVQAIESKA